MAVTESQCRVTSSQIGRIDRIVQALTGRSRAEVRGLFDHDCVKLNGEVCPQAGALVAEADVVIVRQDPRVRYRPKLRPREAGTGAFRLVFEDRDLIVVDKAAAVLTVPTDRGETNTLVDALSRSLIRRGHRSRVSVVHRLDRGTSGLLVFGKNPRVGRELQAQFRAGKPNANTRPSSPAGWNASQERSTADWALPEACSGIRSDLAAPASGRSLITVSRSD